MIDAKTRWLATSVAAMAIALCAVACTSQAQPDASTAESATPAPEATAYSPEVTDGGSDLIANFESCADVGALLGGIVDGREIVIDSVDETGMICEWTDGTGTVGVQIDPEAPAGILTPEQISAAGGTLEEVPAVAEAGGVVYSLRDPSVGSLGVSALLPEATLWITLAGLEPSDDEWSELVALVPKLLGMGE